MTSNVIINFGSNASKVFKDMHAIKGEMKAVQAQAVATTKATRIASVGGPGAFKQGLSSLRFGAGIITGFLGVNVFRELFDPIKKGFEEVVKSSSGFTFAMEAATKGLTQFGAELGKLVTGKAGGFLAQALADVFFPGAPRLQLLAEANAMKRPDAGGLFGPEFTSPVSEYEKWQSKLVALGKAQAAYLKDTVTTLRRMENDLERVNTLDPW